MYAAFMDLPARRPTAFPGQMPHEWDPKEAWERAGQIPEGFQVNPLWEEARRLIHSTPGLAGSVDLDWPKVTEGHCVACGTWAYTSYRGQPVHMSCAGELALFVDLMSKRGRLTTEAPPALP